MNKTMTTITFKNFFEIMKTPMIIGTTIICFFSAVFLVGKLVWVEHEFWLNPARAWNAFLFFSIGFVLVSALLKAIVRTILPEAEVIVLYMSTFFYATNLAGGLLSVNNPEGPSKYVGGFILTLAFWGMLTVLSEEAAKIKSNDGMQKNSILRS